jgi:hypothetical protein
LRTRGRTPSREACCLAPTDFATDERRRKENYKTRTGAERRRQKGKTMKTQINLKPVVSSTSRWIALMATVAVLAASVPSAWAGNDKNGKDSRIMPAAAKVEGKSLADWVRLFTAHLVLNSDPNDYPPVNKADVQIGQVMMLAGNWGEPGEVTVKAGTFLLVNPYILWSETYNNGIPDDSPDMVVNDVPLSEWDQHVTAALTLDGRPLQLDMQDYAVPCTWFDHPVMYAEPSSYGSIGAIFFTGYACVVKPLTPGVHVLTSHVDDQFLFIASWTDTWKITVVP